MLKSFVHVASLFAGIVSSRPVGDERVAGGDEKPRRKGC